MFKTTESITLLAVTVITCMTLSPAAPAAAAEDHRTCEPIPTYQKSYPTDPNSDTAWSGGSVTVADIEAAFNAGRSAENSQLGLSIPMLTMPSQGTWDAMSSSERGLWLVNRERIDRGVTPLHGIESNVIDVAQTYADFLFNDDLWGHEEDGQTPWERLAANPAIGACSDFLSVAENLALWVSSVDDLTSPVARAIYGFNYNDGSCCGWGHRHAVLWFPYTENGGDPGMEGFLGIGVATGGPYQGPFDNPWPYANLLVMNVFDPCASWSYDDSIFSDDFETGDIGAWANILR